MKYLAWSLLGRGSAESLGSSDSTSDGLAEFLYVLFLILGTVMLMNMMIALLSNIYQHVEVNFIFFKIIQMIYSKIDSNIYNTIFTPFRNVTLCTISNYNSY
jgi:hypothetical protein